MSARGRAIASVPGMNAALGRATTQFEAGLVNPAGSQGLRYKDEGNSFPTSTATLHTVFPIQYAGGNAGTYSTMPGGQFNAYLHRDILRAMTLWVPNPAPSKGYSYTAMFYEAGVQNTLTVVNPEPAEEQPMDFLWMNDAYAVTDSTHIHPHGPVLYPGQASQKKGIWMDTGAVMTFKQYTTPNTTSSMVVYVWDGNTFSDAKSITAFAGGIAAFTSAACGYYYFSYTDTAGVINSVGAVLTGSGDVWGHLTVPQVEAQLPNLTHARIVANSLLLSDTASMMNVEGQVWAAQFPGNLLWHSNFTAGFTASNVNYFEGRAATGVYGWLKPQSLGDFAYANTISANGTVLTCASFPLDSGHGYAGFLITVGAVGGTFPALDFLLTESIAIEFISYSQWFENEMASLTTVARMDSIDRLAYVDQFLENPTHLATLWKSIRGTAGFFKKHAGTITGALGAMFPQYAMAFGAAGALTRAL
jgi:hypothetical protein